MTLIYVRRIFRIYSKNKSLLRIRWIPWTINIFDVHSLSRFGNILFFNFISICKCRRSRYVFVFSYRSICKWKRCLRITVLKSWISSTWAGDTVMPRDQFKQNIQFSFKAVMSVDLERRSVPKPKDWAVARNVFDSNKLFNPIQ